MALMRPILTPPTAPGKARPLSLEMRPECERCGAELPHDAEAFICSYECTFCPVSTEAMSAVCPNCGGELLRRPWRRA